MVVQKLKTWRTDAWPSSQWGAMRVGPKTLVSLFSLYFERIMIGNRKSTNSWWLTTSAISTAVRRRKFRHGDHFLSLSRRNNFCVFVVILCMGRVSIALHRIPCRSLQGIESRRTHDDTRQAPSRLFGLECYGMEAIFVCCAAAKIFLDFSVVWSIWIRQIIVSNMKSSDDRLGVTCGPCSSSYVLLLNVGKSSYILRNNDHVICLTLPKFSAEIEKIIWIAVLLVSNFVSSYVFMKLVILCEQDGQIVVVQLHNYNLPWEVSCLLTL
jgi:hypothetical protein